MKTINVDIDGVLRYFLAAAHKAIREVYPDRSPETIDDSKEWGMETHYPLIPKKELLSFLFNTAAEKVFWTYAEPFEGAKAFVTKLQKHYGYKVILNTHQNSKTFKYTIEWLQQYKIPYDYLIYSRGEDKHITSGILIDDKFDNCNPETDLLFTRPSNKTLEYAGTRVKNYQEVFDYLDKQ